MKPDFNVKFETVFMMYCKTAEYRNHATAAT